ncbi:MAG: glycoside hydrolase family 30 beta sandwich domain-containing protein, partial [Nitriliruptorales bacterium]|nr:glycoside hydrolase family 30 beta sandwich domain-containing protein [Nitriliruptorales bacterium]
KDLKDGRNSAWQGRALAGLFEIDSRGDNVRLSLRPDTRYNLQYFNAIRGGAVRIGASSSRPAHFDPLAFVNSEGGYVVVVLADEAGALTIEIADGGAVVVATASEQQAPGQNEGDQA